MQMEESHYTHFLMKFSSLKMNRDRELEPNVPGRLKVAALLATWRILPSYGPL
jgi:hypothetical protein